MMNNADRWFLIYSSIVGISHHPRAVENAKQYGRVIVSFKQAADQTDEAMFEFYRRFGRPEADLEVPHEDGERRVA
jgi:hypothetical protein